MSRSKPHPAGTRHFSIDTAPPPETSSSRFSIYDLRSVKKDILTVFDAAEHGDNRAIMRFSKTKNFDVDAKDRYGRTALIWACDCGHHACVESLIRLSANINVTDSHTGRSTLAHNLQIALGEPPRRLYIGQHVQGISLLLLEFGVSLSHQGLKPVDWNDSDLIASLWYQELLIQYGADFKTADHYGLTPLYLAKSKGFEGETVFKYLLSEGAPYNEIKSVDVSKIEREIAQKMAQIDDEQNGHKEEEP